MPVPPPKFWQSRGIYQHITLSDHTIDGSVCLFVLQIYVFVSVLFEDGLLTFESVCVGIVCPPPLLFKQCCVVGPV